VDVAEVVVSIGFLQILALETRVEVMYLRFVLNLTKGIHMLLPPLAYLDNEPPPSSSNPHSDRGLEDPLAVLSTMIEHRKRERAIAAGTSTDDAIATQKRERLDPANDVFQKIR
jgi:hypothetical protein